VKSTSLCWLLMIQERRPQMTNKLKIVYELTNSNTNEKYVGVTSGILEIRLKDHIQKAEKGVNTKIYNSIATHGIENFEIKAIDSTYSIEELAQLEKKYIAENRKKGISLNTDIGGGFQKPVYKYSLENRNLICGYPSLNEASKDCGESTKLISKAALNERTVIGGFYWSYNRYEIINPIKDRRLKRVYQYNASYSGNPLAEFSSVAEASRKTGVYKGCIAKVCRGERKIAGGYGWKYKE